MGNFVEGSRHSGSATEAVWDLLAAVDSWPETFTPHLKRAHLEGPLAVGTTGWVQTRLPLPRSSFTVTSLEPGKQWSWRGKLLWLTMDFDHRCQTTDSGCLIVFEVSLNGPLASIIRPLARLVYRPQMEKALDLLVEAAAKT